MSCSEMGSHSCPRATVITRSTARRCAARVSSRPTKFGPSDSSCLIASVCRILSQRFAQLRGNGSGNYLPALALHARDLLLATGHQLLIPSGNPPVLEVHRDAVLTQFTKAHA